jgi:hypothetical protein
VIARAIAAAAVLAAGLAQAQVEGRLYTCAMHPEIRRAAPGQCPICKMPLVAVPIDTAQAYFLDVEISPPGTPVAEPLALRLRVRDPRTREVVRRFAIVHEQPLHLFIVAEALDWFEHVHPRREADGSFAITLRLPRRGRYQLIADFVPEGAAPQLIQRAIATAGWAGPLVVAALSPGPTVVMSEGLRFSVSPASFVATRATELELEVRAADGTTAALEPYLGADVHLLAVSADLGDVVHAHGVRDRGGTLRVPLCLPRAGLYRLFVQVQHHGQVRTAIFTVPVATMAESTR